VACTWHPQGPPGTHGTPTFSASSWPTCHLGRIGMPRWVRPAGSSTARSASQRPTPPSWS